MNASELEAEDSVVDRATDVENSGILEADLMAIYTHAPYLGEWGTFDKIGNSLITDYNRVDFIKNGRSGHTDGIDFSDLFTLCKDYNCKDNIPSRYYSELKFDQKPINKIKLKFKQARVISPNQNKNNNTSNNESNIDIATTIDDNSNNINSSNDSNDSSSSWFWSNSDSNGSTNKNTTKTKVISKELENIFNNYNNKSSQMKEIEIINEQNASKGNKNQGRFARFRKKIRPGNDNDNNNNNKESQTDDDENANENISRQVDSGFVPLGIRRLGGVQKAPSLTKCVKRVQGPVIPDGSIKMQGSMVFMVPRSEVEKQNGSGNGRNRNTGKGDGNSGDDEVIPSKIPLIEVGDFVSIKQTEIWDLQPNEFTRDELNGKIIIQREATNENDRKKIDSFEIEYDCQIVLNKDTTDFVV